MFRFSSFRVSTASVLLGLFLLAGCSSSEDRAQSHFERGVELAAQGELVKATLEFRNALKLDDSKVDALFELGKVQERQGELVSAARLYSSVAERQADHVEARVRLANILLAAGQNDEAARYTDQALKIAKDDPSALVTKAALELKRGNRDSAVSLADKVLENDPKNSDALMVLAAERLQLGKSDEALVFLDKASSEDERNIGVQLLRLTALEILGDQERVENVFARLIELFPDNPGFRQGLVQWYLTKGRSEDAERTLRAYVSAKPDNEAAQFALVSFLRTQKGDAAAIEHLRALVSDPAISDEMQFRMKMALAQLQFSSGDRSGATELMGSVIDTAEGEDRNRARIAYAAMEAEQENFDIAEELVDTVIEEDPKNPDALAIRAQIKLANGRNEAASDDLLLAINEAPDNSRLRLLLGDAYEKTGKVTLAEESYAKALALNDNPAEAGLQMARFLLRYGRTDRARQVLEDVATRAPNDRRVLSLLGDVRLRTQDWVGAEDIANKLRALAKGAESSIADKIAAAALNGQEKYSDSINLLKASIPAGDKGMNADLVRAYVQAGQIDKAEAYLKQFLANNPDDAGGLVLLGSIYASTQRLDEAEKALKTAAAGGEAELGSTALAQFYSATGRLADAEKAARAGMERNPASRTLPYLLSAILQSEERFDEAIAIYERLFQDDPSSTAVANDLASLLSERKGDPASLDRAFEIAQRFQNSEVPQYLDTLGWIQYLRGDYASALPLIKSASERLPNIGLIHYHLGMVLKALDQVEPSIASLEKAVSQSASMTESDLKAARIAIEDLKGQETSSASN